MSLKRSHIFWITLLTAALARLPMYLILPDSPLAQFHRVPGLDMATLLGFGEWLNNPDNYILLVPHRIMTFLIWWGHQQTHVVGWHFALQGLMGITAALMVADLTLKLTHRRGIALAAGLWSAVYPVSILYENAVLQETILSWTILGAFYLTIKFSRCQWRTWHSWGCGAAWGIATLGRPVAILFAPVMLAWSSWQLCRRRPRHWRLALTGLWGGLLGLWLWAGVFNSLTHPQTPFPEAFSPFFNVLPYSVAYNSAPTAAARRTAAPATVTCSKIWLSVQKMVRRAPQMFVPYEIPENLNYHFLKRYLPLPTAWFGPRLLLPFTISGMLLIGLIALCGLKRERHQLLILLPIVSMVFLLCVREPIGRYRLLLVPYFIIVAVLPFAQLYRHNYRGVLSASVLAVICAVMSGFWFPAPLRPADFNAWGLAQQFQARQVTPEALHSFKAGWELSRHTDQACAVNLLLGYIKLNQPQAAWQVTTEGLRKKRVNEHLLHYYRALLLMPQAPTAAEAELRKIDPPQISAVAFRYYFLCGEVQRQRQNYAPALKFYRQALACPGGGTLRKTTEKLTVLCQKKLQKIPENLQFK